MDAIQRESGFSPKHYYEDFYFEFLEFLYHNKKEVFDRPEACILNGGLLATEIIYAAGLIPVSIEVMPVLFPSTQSSETTLNLADKYFMNTGTCSFNRFALPAFESRTLPLPKAFAFTTLCRDAAKNLQMLGHRFGREFFGIDLPYSETPEAVRYVAQQYRGLADFLGTLTGKPFDIQRLREIIKIADETKAYLVKGNRLREGLALPPLYGGQMLRFMNLLGYLGDPRTLEFAKKYFHLVQARSETQVSPVKEVKARILWIGGSPLHEREFFTYMEKELKAVIIFDARSYISEDPREDADPFVTLARNNLEIGLIGGIHHKLKIINGLIDRYRIDGVIHFAHLNCMLWNSSVSLIKNEMITKGVPFLELSGDCVDQRNSGLEQLMTRLEAFVEMLAD